jgi:hypothetical protein
MIDMQRIKISRQAREVDDIGFGDRSRATAPTIIFAKIIEIEGLHPRLPVLLLPAVPCPCLAETKFVDRFAHAIPKAGADCRQNAKRDKVSFHVRFSKLRVTTQRLPRQL